MSQSKSGIQAVEVAFKILKAFSRSKSELTLNEISKETGYHKSQLYRYLNSLVNIGALIKHEESTYPLWSLGPELIELGEAAFASLDVANEAKPHLIKLKDKLNETVALCIWRENGPFFVRWEKSNNLINIGLDTGSYVPLYSATGMIFRAFMPETITDPILENELEESAVDPTLLKGEIEQVKEKKLSTSNSRLIKGISAISTPIFYPSGSLAAAISVVGFEGNLDVSEDGEAVQSLIETANDISKKLGFMK
ncbi:IclR family transcriptional regulator [Pontibacillus marinus]|uniref:IclR family transcriptional regulator n=1 Tax=Pontibacillus marinus BH030004 = DSM 16465 TaxID=1385511 RepID=A0A0A5HSP1_9BACI|nr:IclR family transcriptional regulator [Pontibacillus marinus]KGX86662.1 hypothetical protein N783_11740 [Pontibacillus marinus BH030004 = DSM 16465]